MLGKATHVTENHDSQKWGMVIKMTQNVQSIIAQNRIGTKTVFFIFGEDSDRVCLNIELFG